MRSASGSPAHPSTSRRSASASGSVRSRPTMCRSSSVAEASSSRPRWKPLVSADSPLRETTTTALPAVPGSSWATSAAPSWSAASSSTTSSRVPLVSVR